MQLIVCVPLHGQLCIICRSICLGVWIFRVGLCFACWWTAENDLLAFGVEMLCAHNLCVCLCVCFRIYSKPSRSGWLFITCIPHCNPCILAWITLSVSSNRQRNPHCGEPPGNSTKWIHYIRPDVLALVLVCSLFRAKPVRPPVAILMMMKYSS